MVEPLNKGYTVIVLNTKGVPLKSNIDCPQHVVRDNLELAIDYIF